MTEQLEPLPEATVVIPTGVPAELINHYRTVMRWRNRVVAVALALFVLGVICAAIVINHQTALGREILAQSRQNGDLLAKRNAELRQQVDTARDLLTQLYAALNASQKQVISLGGVPEHFEFSVPTTTTVPVSGQGSVTTTATPPEPPGSGNAAGNVTVGLDSSLVLGLVFTPMLVPLLIPSTTIEVLPEPTTTEPPPTVEVTVPPITLPPVTVPVPTIPPPLGSG